MRSIVSIALLFPTFSYAGDLPVSLTYGTASACQLYSTGGSQAVFAGVSATSASPGDESSIILIRRSEMIGPEWKCKSSDADVSGFKVSLTCIGKSGGFTSHATIFEHRALGSLTYIDEQRTMTLQRCKKSKRR